MKKILILSILLLGSYFVKSQDDEARLLRFPAIYGNQVVFTYAGDLYSVSTEGGTARRLTSDDGYEMFARFSPDGKTIAFTGQYDGNTEVYLMPAEGGSPKRITYTATLKRDDIADRMGPNNIAMCWRDNENVIFRSRKQTFNSFVGQLFAAPVNGDIPEELPFLTGGFCSYSPDKTKLAFNKVFREFRTWKYYKGGMADDVWIYDFKTKKTENISNNIAQDIFPMWAGNKVYFLSDRDRIMNMFCYNIETKETKKVTSFEKYDIKFPSIGKDAIVFENGGYIYRFDLKTEEAKKISIRIANDQLYGRSQLKDASKNINSYSISPDGKRIGFSARGDIFTVPVNSGITWNLTKTNGVHDRNVNWSPDGEYLAYISDASGEDEIYILKKDGAEKAIQLTKGADTYKFNMKWSPDSKKILWADKKLRLQYVDVESKKVTLVSEAKTWEFRQFSWSPDSKWIAYRMPSKTGKDQLHLYSMESKEDKAVTEDWYNCASPSFSDDGKFLFFTSDRDFNPIYSWTEWNHAFKDMSNIYFIALNKEVKSPFEPKNDVVNAEDKKDEKKDENSGEITVKVDFDGIVGRIEKLPIKAGVYWNARKIGCIVYYNKRSETGKSQLLSYDLKKQKETVLGEDFFTYQITKNKKKMMVRKGSNYYVIDLPKTKIKADKKVDLSGMKVKVDLAKEWQQIYTETWRQMKHFFYDPNMHGVDWESVREKYQPLVRHAKHRNDLSYIMGELIGEVNVGHAYVGGGDRPKPARVNMGLLGAKISRDKSGYYKIDKILKGENWAKNTVSPLTKIGVNVSEGDYIIAINGEPVKEMSNIFEALIGKVGKQVEFTVNSEPKETGAHTEIIKPIADESDLYYYNWVRENMRKVDEATNGQVGYIHIPDMGPGGLVQFVKQFYPQLNKRALIVDDRGNGGGNVSPMIIERLLRQLTFVQMSRNTTPTTRPAQMMVGPKVCLVNQYSASDGDLFPYQFKTLKIGKLIGQRTWGGVVGIRGSHPFIDGGELRKPEFAHYDKDGKEFIVEGWGVEPDIEVINDPAKEYAGEDEQLNKAIEVILEEMKKLNLEVPEMPPFPDKSK